MICTLLVIYFSPQTLLKFENCLVVSTVHAREKERIRILNSQSHKQYPKDTAHGCLRSQLALEDLDLKTSHTNGQDIIFNLVEDGIRKNSVGKGSITESIPIMEITCSNISLHRLSKCRRGFLIPVSTSNKSTPRLPAICCICLENETKSPQSAP
jgi:hypothetical protein